MNSDVLFCETTRSFKFKTLLTFLPYLQGHKSELA